MYLGIGGISVHEDFMCNNLAMGEGFIYPTTRILKLCDYEYFWMEKLFFFLLVVKTWRSKTLEWD